MEEVNINNNPGENNPPSRRTVLKALAGVPFLGAFAYELVRKSSFDRIKSKKLINELIIQDIPLPDNISKVEKGDLLRIGIIGFGKRAVALANGLGFMHPDDMEENRKNGTLKNWLAQDSLNVAITGICDVFDLHAGNGLATARNEVQAGGAKPSGLPIKRYQTYQEMLADDSIDAVVIATPDHHHARITTDAVKAGKHVYCEKSISITEDGLNEVYHAVKNSDRVFQLGHQISQSTIFRQAKELMKKDILGKITLVETTTNRNTAKGAWIRDLDKNGNPLPGDETSIDWKQWLGPAPYVPFSTDRYYNWTKWFDYDLGMIGQLFTHEYDAVNQLLGIGIPQSVVSSGGIYYWKDNREIPDVLHCVFEYPERDMSLIYSADLANSRNRGRVFMGTDASMDLGESINVTVDNDSIRYKKLIEDGTIDPSAPMIMVSPGTGKVDAVSSPTQKYYASRGLTTTSINGQEVDVTHLHIKEWINCIRNGETPSCNIDRAFEEGMTCLMAQKSYIEKRRVTWDPIKKAII
jgi:predicted dehydrogenase